MKDSAGEDGHGAVTYNFDDASIRRGFIRKVYSILMCQLLVTMGFIALFVFHEPTKLWTYSNRWILRVALNTTLVMVILMACCPNARRAVPMNFIFLAIFTIAESFLLGVVSSVFDVNEVMIAVGITAAICLGLTLFAFQTKWDFTAIGGILVAAILALLFFGIIVIFIPRNNILNLVYAALGAFLFSVYLVYQTQMMMGGKHKESISPEEYIFAVLNYLFLVYLVYQTQMMMGGKHKESISPEEYIFAALNLYLGIVNLFLFILRCGR